MSISYSSIVLVSSYSKSRTFVGGKGEYIWRMLSAPIPGHEGSFHEKSPGVMSSVRIGQLE